MFVSFLPIAIGLLLTVSLILSLNPLAQRVGWLDSPCARKQHASPIPLTGGVAMCAAFSVALVATQGLDAPLTLLAAMVLLCLIGLWDDVHHLCAWKRLFMQTGVALMLCLFEHTRVDSLGDIFGTGPIILGALALPFTLLAIVGAINAINMIDGLDGLAGSVVLIALGWMAVLAGHAGMLDNMILILTMAACVVGFLYYNMRFPGRTRAVVFMGDAGSTMLGAALAWFIIRLTQEHNEHLGTAFPPVVGLWLVAIPLLDTLSLIVRRLLCGESPFKADRRHLHHLLLRLGFSDALVTVIIMLAAALIGAVGALGWLIGLSETVLFYGFIALGIFYYVIVHHFELGAAK